MPTRKRKASPRRASSAKPLSIATLPLLQLPWFTLLDPQLALSAGTRAPSLLRVPVADANELLTQSIRFVTDSPAGSPSEVVWRQADSELLIRSHAVKLACAPGVITVTIPVWCDQLDKDVAMTVPFAVGTAQRTTGLVMATFTRVGGPDLVASLWSEALTAFAWESILHLARELAGAVGKDGAGKRLVPGSLGAESELLLVQPMARHLLKGRTP